MHSLNSYILIIAYEYAQFLLFVSSSMNYGTPHCIVRQ